MKKIYFLVFSVIFLLFSCGNKEKEKPEKKCESGFKYRADWDSCVDINECNIDNGGCEQICTNKTGSYECSCESPFVLNDDGKTCSDFDNCEENSCRYHGKCIDGIDSFTCECFKGYSGVNCEKCAEGFELYNDECLEKPEILNWHSKDNKMVVAENFVVNSKGDIFVAGFTLGSFDSTDNYGQTDFFLVKINKDMEIQWIKQFGTPSFEDNTSITVDSDDNLYVAGVTGGSFSGSSSGKSDIALIKLDSDGNIIWKNQSGTSDEDGVSDILIDNNKNIYIVGHRYNEETEKYILSLIKYNVNGDEIWTKEEDFSGTKHSYSLALDSFNNIYVAATILDSMNDTENIGNTDLLLIKYDTDGNKLWNKQWGSDKYDDLEKILIYDDEIYVTGLVNGYELQFAGLSGDIFLTKLDTDGNIIFDKNWVGDNKRKGSSVVISPDGKNIYVSGYIRTEYSEDSDMILKKLDMSGNEIFTKRWFNGGEILISLLFNENNLYGLGLISHGSLYSPFLIKFGF